jgi:hypothetical protein
LNKHRQACWTGDAEKPNAGHALAREELPARCRRGPAQGRSCSSLRQRCPPAAHVAFGGWFVRGLLAARSGRDLRTPARRRKAALGDALVPSAISVATIIGPFSPR